MTLTPLASRESTRFALAASLLVTLVLGGGWVFGFWASHGSVPIAIERTCIFAGAMLVTHFVGYRLYRRQAAGPISFSPLYRDAIVAGVLGQGGVLLFASLILMSGLMSLCGIAAGGYWAGVAVILYRRPGSPDKDDLIYIRAGYIITLGITAVLASFVPRFADWH